MASKRVIVQMPATLLAMVDERRGDVSRSLWVRRAVERALDVDGSGRRAVTQVAPEVPAPAEQPGIPRPSGKRSGGKAAGRVDPCEEVAPPSEPEIDRPSGEGAFKREVFEEPLREAAGLPPKAEPDMRAMKALQEPDPPVAQAMVRESLRQLNVRPAREFRGGYPKLGKK